MNANDLCDLVISAALLFISDRVQYYLIHLYIYFVAIQHALHLKKSVSIEVNKIERRSGCLLDAVRVWSLCVCERVNLFHFYHLTLAIMSIQIREKSLIV